MTLQKRNNFLAQNPNNENIITIVLKHTFDLCVQFKQAMFQLQVELQNSQSYNNSQFSSLNRLNTLLIIHTNNNSTSTKQNTFDMV